LTGPPDHDRQDWQWQKPIPSGSPETSSATAPQKQVPEWAIVRVLSQGGITPLYQHFALPL
jgi:hypothetical protein